MPPAARAKGQQGFPAIQITGYAEFKGLCCCLLALFRSYILLLASCLQHSPGDISDLHSIAVPHHGEVKALGQHSLSRV